MISFLCDFRPRSVQAKSTSRYKEAIRKSFKDFYPNHDILLNNDLYAISYYFHKRKTELDADNMSKPIWDALQDLLYEDDRIIKLRYAGTCKIGNEGDISNIDVTKIPDHILEKFLELTECSDDIIYIEVGNLKKEFYVFGVENGLSI